MASSPWSFQARVLFLALILFWGFNYEFVKFGLQFASPLWLAALRASVGAIATLAIVTGLKGWGSLDRAGKRDALLLGLPNTTLFFGLWFWAARDVLPGIAAVVIYTFPLWVSLLSLPVLGHRLGPRHWAAVGAGFIGVALVSQLGQAGGSSVSVPAILMLLGAAFSWALGTVYFQRRFAREEMLEANAYQLIGGSAGLLAAVLILTPTPVPVVGADLVITAAWLGIVGTAAAYTIWFTLLGRTPAATLSGFVFLVPVVALGASAIFFGERLSLLQLGGVGLVLVSIYGIGRAQMFLDRSPNATRPDARTPEIASDRSQ